MNPIEPPYSPGARIVTFAADQPEYRPLPASITKDGVILTAWELTNEERAAIAAGADIHLSVMTFNQPLQPVLIEVGPVPS